MSELTSLNISQLRAGLLSKQFSAKEVVDAHIQRIEKTNEKLNSFISICKESALKEAEQADINIKEKGSESHILTGIPVAIKDMLVTKGLETTCGSNILKGFIPPYTCTAVAKLQKAGAVIVGKTNLDEFAMGSSNENSAFGVTRNPWALDRIPGGSSGGSAVSVSAGQATISLGTDTGGSIRQPASMSGVVGLRPTYGRVSRYGAVAYASSLDQIGPFGRCIDDVAITLEAISGKDIKDSTSMDIEVPNFFHTLVDADNLKGLKIGVPKEYFSSGINSEVEKEVRGAIIRLEQLGAEIVEISLPHTKYALSTYYIIAPAEASSNLSRYDGIRYGKRSAEAKTLSEVYELTREEGFGKEVKRRILIGTYVLSAGYYDAFYLKAQKVRTLICSDFSEAFSHDCDIIAAPVAPTTAFKIGEKTNSPLDMYLADIFTMPANLAGLPSLSMPVAFDSKGLPIGLQLIGKAFDESRLLKTAKVLEKDLAIDIQRKTTEEI